MANANAQVTNSAQPQEASTNKVNRAMKLMNEAGSEKMHEAKDQIQKRYDDARKQLQDFQDSARQSVEKSVETVENRIQQNPFRTVLGVFAIGAILGFLFSRRK